MFLKLLEPIFKPWREMRNKILKVRTVKGNIVSEARRVKRFGNVAQQHKKKIQGHASKAQAGAQKFQGQAQAMQGQAQAMQGQVQPMQGQMPKGPPMQGMPQGAQMPDQGQAGAPGALNPNPPIKIVGFFRRRKICTQCQNQLDKTWDSCPYCAQAAAAAAPAAPAAPSLKTQAFMLDTSGGGSVQLLGWLIPIKGAQRGELFTLAPLSVIGTEPTCTVVLIDHYMSSRHAEIKADGGIWILRDLGSTNGTYVNDKRVDQHELVDNDFIKFGQSLVKFKSL
jgi:hypothetical protein